MKRYITRVIKSLLFSLGCCWLQRHMPFGEYPIILRYHSIFARNTPNDYALPDIQVDIKNFEEQIRYLSNSYRIVSLNHLCAELKETGPLTFRSIVITFDDGYIDNFDYAVPILEKYGTSATFYVVMGAVAKSSEIWNERVLKVLDIALERYGGYEPLGLILKSISAHDSKWTAYRKVSNTIKKGTVEQREGLLSQLESSVGLITHKESKQGSIISWKQIEKMVDAGMTIGSHTLTHANLPNCTESELSKELSISKELLEERYVGHPVHLSYPNGGATSHYNEKVAQMVRGLGYASAGTSESGVISPETDLYALPRIPVFLNESLAEFAFRIEQIRMKEAWVRFFTYQWN